jgi:hypothetical protein
MLGYPQNITGIDPLLGNSVAIDLHTVTTVEIADVPESIIDVQFAMLGRDIGKPQDNITRFPPADQQVLLQQGDGVATADRVQFTVHECSFHDLYMRRTSVTVAQAAMAKLFLGFPKMRYGSWRQGISRKPFQ